MKVLGIDPGTEYTGYGVVEDREGQWCAREWGVIAAKRNKSMPERLRVIHEGLDKIIKRIKPQALAVEEVFYARNVKTALRLGEARGVVLLVAAQWNLPVAEYSAKVVKQSVTGNGGADKFQVQQMVKALLRMETAPEEFHASDALAIAICHLSHLRFTAKMKP
jgi:crossover junction endodeoxyribonuclease RuvC